MSRIVPRLRFALLLSVMSCAVACGSDDMPIDEPEMDAGNPPPDGGGTKDSASDAVVGDVKSDAGPSSDARADQAAQDAGADVRGADSGRVDATADAARDTGADTRLDTGIDARDTGVADVRGDSSSPDVSVNETGAPDASAADTAPDTNSADAGTDINEVDTSAAEAGEADANAADAGAGPDVETADATGVDGTADDGGSPCAAFNGGAGCTPTEQRFANKSADCYLCMATAGCLDDVMFLDTGHECSDVAGTATAGTRAGTSREQLCLDLIDCVMNPANLCAATDVTICYCGTLGAGNGCATAAAGAPDGRCLAQELDGLEHTVDQPPSVVLPDYTALNRGAGMANQLFNCAKSNGCDALCSQQ